MNNEFTCYISLISNTALLQLLYFDRNITLFTNRIISSLVIMMFLLYYRLAVEYPPSGGAMSSQKFRSVKLLRYVSVGDYIIMGCEFVFIAFIFYYLVEECFEVRDIFFNSCVEK